MSLPTVVLVSFHFYPADEVGGRRTTAFAQYMAANGVQVVVVSAFGGRKVVRGSEILPGIIAAPVKPPRRWFVEFMLSLKRLRSLSNEASSLRSMPQPRPRRSIASPVGGFLRELFFRIAYFVDPNKAWAWRATAAAVVSGKEHRARAILSSAPPNTALLAGTLAAKRLGVPHIADLRDPWTDAVISDERRRLDYLLQRPLERWVMNSARTVTSSGTTVAQILGSRYPRAATKIHVIRNGYDGALIRTSTDTGGRLSILFAGELYLGRNPFPFLAAMETLLGRADVDFRRIGVTFMGDADRYADQSISDWLAGKRCEQITRILPRGPRECVAEEMSRATVLLNLAQNQPLSVPAKTYEHLAAGREILLICESDSETSRVVAGINGVNLADPRQLGHLEAVLLDLYRRHVIGRRMSVPPEDDVRRFSRASANRQFWSIVDSAVGLTTRPQQPLPPAADALSED